MKRSGLFIAILVSFLSPPTKAEMLRPLGESGAGRVEILVDEKGQAGNVIIRDSAADSLLNAMSAIPLNTDGAGEAGASAVIRNGQEVRCAQTQRARGVMTEMTDRCVFGGITGKGHIVAKARLQTFAGLSFGTAEALYSRDGKLTGILIRGDAASVLWTTLTAVRAVAINPHDLPSNLFEDAIPTGQLPDLKANAETWVKIGLNLKCVEEGNEPSTSNPVGKVLCVMGPVSENGQVGPSPQGWPQYPPLVKQVRR